MASSIKYQFTMPARYKMWAMILSGVGVLSLIIGFFVYRGGEHGDTRFWA